ncbi:MAG TPA: VanZ family protein, partial [Anaerolineales bacterium]|nr:VanZ family protein [Anaerolineales bacterium]
MINELLVLAITVFAWIIYRGAIWRRAWRRKASLSIGRELVVNLLFVYLLVVFHLTFFPMNIVLYSYGPYKANFIPLVKTIHMIRYINPLVVVNILGNLVLLAPLGIFLPVLSPRFRSWGAILGAGFLVTLTIEVFQYFLAVRVFDIDDLIINTLGVALGYALFLLLKKVPFVARRLERSPGQSQTENITPLLVFCGFGLLSFLALFFSQIWSQTKTRSMLLDDLRKEEQQILAQGASGRYFFTFSETLSGAKKVDYYRQVILDRYTPVEYIEGLRLAEEEFRVSGTSYDGEVTDFMVIAHSDQDIAAMTSQAARFPVFASDEYYFSFASLPVDQPDAY